MQRLARIFGVLLIVAAFPTLAFAQAQIAGVVKDSSGAILPGVTVEAASPALIEKTRSVVTDGTGQYKIVDLRPGSYTVTATLPGFNTVKRGGVELTGNFVASINIEMKVGAIEETITVTGETPIVDIQSTTQQHVLSLDTINSLPAGRNFDQIATLVPGVSASGGGTRNIGNVIGGASGDGLEFHGTVNADSRVTVNGLNVMTLQAGGGLGRSHPDLATAQEVTIDTSSVSAELPVGGVRMNLIPRDGGNAWHGTAINSYANSSLQASNFTQRLKDAQLAGVPAIDYNWDLNGGFGGPFKKDKVWFWLAGRKALLSNSATVFVNQNAYKPSEWLYVPDSSQVGYNKGRYQTLQLRTTWQATPKNKFALTYKYDGYCQCPSNINSTVSPEAGADNRNPRLRQYHAEWTAPITNKVLFEAVGMYLFERWGGMNLQPRGSLDDPALLAIQPQMISVTDQSNNLTYRNLANANNTLVPNYALRQAVSYVTGAHAVKFGLNETFGFIDTTSYTPSALPVAYRFQTINGVTRPNQITQRAWPLPAHFDENMDFGAFVQDKWTLKRLTVTGALRFDYIHTSAPEQTIGPSALTPTRNVTFPYTDILQWKDITFRSGFVYDLQGDGKTAVKVAFNKYLNGQTLNGIGQAPAPVNTLVSQTTRTWTDDGAGGGIANDFVPQCDLTNNGKQGECAAVAASNFGTTAPGTAYDPKLLNGWGVRPYNYEFSASVQRELVPRVSIDVGYFRRIFGNLTTTDNLAVAPSDYDTFSILAPMDSRLPGGGGYTVNGLYDLKPTVFDEHRPQQNYVTLSDHYGTQIQHWNGVDININARLRNGLTLIGGVSTGKTVVDNCAIVQQIPELLNGTANSNATSFPATFTGVWTSATDCHQESPFLTQVKAQGIYTIPRIDVQLSGAYATSPGPLIAANYVANNAAVLPSLGRPLAGGAPNMTANVLSPGALYGERLQDIDLSVGKIFRVNGSRLNLRADIYNLLNMDTVVSVNNSFATWQKPIDLVPARFAKITVTFDF